jgi:uncharacterized phage protein gp47/JayE
MAITTETVYPTPTELVRQYKEDLELAALDAGIDPPPMGPGSDWDLKAVATANRFSLIVAAIQTFDNDANPLTASGAPLDELLRADGLPEALPAPGAGQVLATVTGTATIPAGLKFQASGMKGTVTRTILDYIGSTGPVLVDVIMDTTGAATNLVAGTVVRWLNQPANVATEAVVVTTFVGGVGAETDERKRMRLLTSRQNPPAGGNWSQKVLEALASSGSIAGAFAYPALGGPASTKIVLTSNTSTTSREVTQSVIDAVVARFAVKFPIEQELIMVESALNQLTDVALSLRLPSSGNGVWLAHGPSSPASVLSMSGPTAFIVQAVAGDASGILAGDTIAAWSTTTHVFGIAAIETVTALGGNSFSLTTGLWSNYTPVVGDWICPACEGLDAISTQWKVSMIEMGPGENIRSADPRFGRSYRHPDVTERAPMELSARQTGALMSAIPDVIRAQYLLPTGDELIPATPGEVGNRPYVICLRKFGVYIL